jgi:prepilin-type processing-associated H-X9-DG protein
MFRSLPRRALLWATLPALLLAPNAFAAGDDHREQIAIESWSLGAAHGSGGGGGAGKVSYSDLSVMISLEKASPLLQFALADGEHFDAAELTFRAPAGVQARAGDDKRQDYLTVTLEEVMVSSYQISGSTARLSLNFTRIANAGTGKTMAAEVLASTVGGANFALADGSVRFLR